MSVEYTFYNKPLSRTALLEDTDFTIENHNGSDWIIDKDVANIRIKSANDDEIYELEDHGFKDIQNIMDTIVEKYKITFYTDNELHNYYQLQHHNRENKPFPYPDMLNADGTFNFEAAVCRDMKDRGEYVVLDAVKGEVLIPQRNEQTTMEEPQEKEGYPYYLTDQQLAIITQLLENTKQDGAAELELQLLSQRKQHQENWIDIQDDLPKWITNQDELPF